MECKASNRPKSVSTRLPLQQLVMIRLPRLHFGVTEGRVGPLLVITGVWALIIDRIYLFYYRKRGKGTPASKKAATESQ